MKTLIDKQSRPLSGEEVRLLIQLFLIEKRGVFDFFNEEIKEISGAMILQKRWEIFSKGISYKPTLIVFIASLCKSPGEIVMWAYAIHKLAKERNFIEVGLEEWSQMWPTGIPEEKDYHEVWLSQKCDPKFSDTDNLLDKLETWK